MTIILSSFLVADQLCSIYKLLISTNLRDKLAKQIYNASKGHGAPYVSAFYIKTNTRSSFANKQTNK